MTPLLCYVVGLRKDSILEVRTTATFKKPLTQTSIIHYHFKTTQLKLKKSKLLYWNKPGFFAPILNNLLHVIFVEFCNGEMQSKTRSAEKKHGLENVKAI